MSTKSKRLQVRLTDAEYRALALMAARQGKTMSELIRAHVRELAKKQGIPHE